MKPTTEQILSALNEMIQSKTELKAEKVQLGAIDDLLKKTKQISGKGADAFKKAKDAADDLSKVVTTLYKYEDEAMKLEEMAKELGADSAIKEVQSIWSIINTRAKDWDKAERTIRQGTKLG